MKTIGVTAIIATLIAALYFGGAFDRMFDSPSGPTPTPTPKPPPITVTLKQVGVTRSHEAIGFLQGADDIRLLVTVSDGGDTEQVLILPPKDDDPWSVEVDRPAAVNEVLYHVDAAKGSLRINVVAIEEDGVSWIGPVAEIALNFVDGTGGFVAEAILDSAMTQGLLGEGADPVGYYEGAWSSNSHWGSGRYQAVGEQDLLLWFDIDVGGELRQTVSGG